MGFEPVTTTNQMDLCKENVLIFTVIDRVPWCQFLEGGEKQRRRKDISIHSVSAIAVGCICCTKNFNLISCFNNGEEDTSNKNVQVSKIFLQR